LIVLSQLDRKYTTQPPDVRRWTKGESEAADQPAEQGGVTKPLLVLDIGDRVEALFDIDHGTGREWFGGVVVQVDSAQKDGVPVPQYRIHFDDGEKCDIPGDKTRSVLDCDCDNSDIRCAGDDRDLRQESGPWASWLQLYLPDLLLTVYQAARRNASLSNPVYFDQMQNPENFVDKDKEFHHSNFCDVLVPRFKEDDALSHAGTPAHTKRRRQ
jgi:hypothetical protein